MVMLKGKNYTGDDLGTNFGHKKKTQAGADGVTRDQWENLFIDGIAEMSDRVTAVTALQQGAADSAAAASSSQTAAAGSATAAGNSASAAHTSELAAASSAGAAAGSATAAAGSADAASGSASAASSSATLSSEYAAAAGGSIPSVRLTWDTATADADPGNGKVRASSPTAAAATALYVDNLDVAGASITTVLDRWTASTNTVKGTLRIAHRTDATKWVEYLVTGTVVDGTGYRKITVTGGTGPGGFAAGDPVAVGFSRAGDAPTSFSAGTAAVPGWAVTGDGNTGLAQVAGADTLSVTTGGVERARFADSISYLLGCWQQIVDAAGVVKGMFGPTGAGTVVMGSFSNHDVEVRAGNLLVALFKYVAGAARYPVFTPSVAGNPKVSSSAGGLDITAADGNAVTVGGGQTGQFPTQLQIPESTHATSRRATLNIGSGWGLLSDISGAGVRDFGLWCGALSVAVFKAAANGVMTFGRAVFATPVNLGNVSGTVTLDLSLGNRFDMTLIGNVVLANPTGGSNGQTVVINAKQDGTGGRTMSCGTYFKTKSAAGITLSTAANARDKIVLEQYSSAEIDAAIGKDYR